MSQLFTRVISSLFLVYYFTNSTFAQTYNLGTVSAPSNTTITTCSGTIYDSGGAAGAYGNNENTTVTFTSSTGQPLILNITGTMAIAANDVLTIYNGTNTSAPVAGTINGGVAGVSGGAAYSLLCVGTSGSLTIRFVSNAIGTASGWSGTFRCATATTTNACSGSFTDSGGASNYADNASSVTSICSNNGGQARVTFSAFNLETNFDYLYVFNGSNTLATQVAGSPFTGTISPGTVTATGSCLTFLFVSDNSGTAPGWNSTISCINGCSAATVTATPTCSGAQYNVTGTIATTVTSGTITVTDGAASQVITLPQVSPIPYTLTGLTPGTGSHTVTATFSVGAVCNGTVNYTAPASCSSGPTADYVLNGASNGTTVMTCTGKFSDSGNLSANYSDSENNTITFTSSNGKQPTVTFNNFATEAGSDLLYIYDGATIGSPQVPGSPFSGSGSAASPGVVTGSGTSLTFRFVSNGSTNRFGWDADISCSGGIAALPPAPTWTGYPGGACAPNTKIEGTVYEDFNNNGIKETAEPFIKGVEVKLYDNTGQVGAAVLTNASGFYTFTGLAAAGLYRVEFTVPANFEEGAAGTGSNTAVQFVRAGTCNANLALLDRGHYCGLTNPKWTIPMYANGSPSHPSNSGSIGVARFNYNATGQSPNASQENWVTFGTVGTTWGTAYRRDDATLYMASVLRRHTGLGPAGIGAIYKRPDSGNNTTAPVFYDFGSLAGTVADNATRFPGAGNSFGALGACGLCDNLDPTVFGQIGKVGLGDIDLSADEKTMYVTNLFDRKVYTIDVNNPVAGSATPLPGQPWLTGSPCANGTARPWALKYRQGKLYVGVVCDGGSSPCSKTGACNDLTATVYSYNGTTWTTEITYPLNYYRKAYALGSNYWVKWMDNWSDFLANYANVTDAHFAQPVLVDIEFDDDGSMIMGFGDRTAMQTGYQAPPPPGPASSTAERTFAHGDMLRAAFNPGTGTFTLENNGVAGTRVSTNPASNVGPGGKAFYYGDHWYGANNDANIGSLAILPGSGEVLHPVADPIDPYASGVVWSSNFNGSAVRKLEVYQGSPTGNSPNFAKNGGLGDIELFCANPPIEIGNYVWWDHNLNGRMDPSEPGIPGVALKLYLNPDGSATANGDETLVATTTSDPSGRYIFSVQGAVNGLNAQTWTAPNNRVLPNTRYLISVTNFATDPGLTAYATSIGSTSSLPSPTQNQGSGGAERDSDGSSNAGNVSTPVVTGAAGQHDHQFDFGFGPGGACSVQAIPTGNTPCVGEALNLNANATGGTAPFTYSWSGPNGFTATAAAPSIANVTAAADGMYTVTVTDASSCVAIFTVNIQINSITVTATATPTACGGSTGSINLTPAGGFTPYGYDWANNALDGTEDPTGLAAGSYPVTVTDANGCTASTTASVANTGGPTLTVVPVNPTCGQSNGSIALTPVGGTPGYTFTWNPNTLTGANPTGLAAGTYAVTVTDGAGCITSTAVTLTNTAGPSVAATFVNTTCGLTNGSINITPSGGTGSYTYDWNVNALDGTEDPTNLAAGTYTVTVRDVNNCEISTTITIAPSVGFTASATGVNATCGSPNGSINLTVNLGTAPFTYDWNNVPGASNMEDQTDVAAGTYTVTVTDVNNCTATASVTLTTTTGPTTLNTTVTNAVSCVANNGAIDLQVLGGASPYTYDWNNDGHPAPDFDTEDLSGLAAGNYVVTVTDNNGCTATTAATVGLLSGASVAATIVDPTNCTQTGSITLAVTGGVTPYTFNWAHIPGTSNPQNLTGLAGGTYQVTVTEGNGCTVASAHSIRQIRGPVASVTVVDPACAATNGEIDLSVILPDATSIVSVDWSNIAGTSNPQDQTGLSAGNYTVTITDDLQCTGTLTVNLGSTTAPVLTLTNTNGTCSQNNGEIALTIAGGVAPYTIDWDNIASSPNPTQLQTGLGAGTYAVTVTDNAGCAAVGTVTLEVTAGVAITCTPTDAVTPPGGNGSIAVDAEGIGPFTFDWSVNTLDGIQNPTGLSAGNYNLVVTDAGGCTAPCNNVIANRPLADPTIVDPCACHDVEYDPTEGLELLDFIEVMDAPGKTWQITSQTGMEVVDPFNNIPLPVPATLTYDPVGGVYRIQFAHTSNVGYSAVVTDGTFTKTISNACPKNVPVYPSLPASICTNATPVALPANQTHFTASYHIGSVNSPAITVFDPSLYANQTSVDVVVRFTPLSVLDCPATVRFSVQITNATPPTVTNGAVCIGDVIDLNSLVTSAGGVIPVFYPTVADANAGTNRLINQVVRPLVNTTYQVRAENAGCASTVLPINVTVNPLPAMTVIDGTVCPSGGTIDLATLVTNTGGGTLSFYSSQADADNGVNPLPSSVVSITMATNFFIRSQSATNCFVVKISTCNPSAPACGVPTVTRN
jgi:hypothetical protein